MATNENAFYSNAYRYGSDEEGEEGKRLEGTKKDKHGWRSSSGFRHSIDSF